jgi:hypothetical protein
MPFDESRASPGTPLETDYLMSQRIGRKLPAPSPDILTTTGAAFRQNNLVGSIVSSHKLYKMATGEFYDIDPDFNAFAPENLKGYEEYLDHFVHVFNKRAMDAVKADIDQERKDREDLDRAGMFGAVMNIVASTADLPTFIPGGGLVRAGRGGFSVARSAFSMGRAAVVSNSVQEAGLHISQELRTVDESLVGIGGSVIAAGLLGTRHAARLTQLEHAAAARAFDAAKASDFDAATNALHAEMTGFSAPRPAGDADLRPASSADPSIAGNAVPDTAKAAPAAPTAAPTSAMTTAELNPLLRMQNSPSAAVRDIGAQMMENPVYLSKTPLFKETLAGNAAGAGAAAAETLPEFARRALDKAVEAHRAAYIDARKAGLAMTEREFHEDVGRAMRRGGQNDIPAVARAAGAWRSHVVEPLTKRAIETGLLPKDVDAAGASAYFSRLWNREAIEANEQEFKGILHGYFDGQASAATAREAAEKQKTLSGPEGAKADPQAATAESGAAAGGKSGLSHRAGHFLKHLPHFAAEQLETGLYKFAIGLVGIEPDDAGGGDGTGPGEIGPEKAGPEKAGPEQTGPEQTGPAKTGPRVRSNFESRINDHAARTAPELHDPAARADYVNGIVDDVYDRLTGRATEGFPPDITLAAQGPLKGRSFDIPDALVEKFLDDDAGRIGRRYARTMAADIELAERFGSPGMEEAFERVRHDYADLRAQTGNNPAGNNLAGDNLTGGDPAALQRLDERERADIADLQAVRDMLRGNARPEAQDTSWARIRADAGVFDYIRTMGGASIGALADAVRPLMVQGFTGFMKDAIDPMLRGVTAAGLGMEEAGRAGAIGQKILASRMAALAQITDPYADGPVFGRFLANMAEGRPLLTGLMHWDDFQKTLATRLIEDRILANAEKATQDGFASLPPGERAYMDAIGFGNERAEDLGRFFASHGQTLDGIRLANAESRGDDTAAATISRALRAAIDKETRSLTSASGDDDTPLFAATPLGRTLQRFRSLAIASNQRVLLRGLPEDQTRLLGAITGMTTIGAFLHALSALEAGQALPEDPTIWATEGLNRSGLFTVGFTLNNALEKSGVPGLAAGARLPTAFASLPHWRRLLDALLGRR